MPQALGAAGMGPPRCLPPGTAPPRKMWAPPACPAVSGPQAGPEPDGSGRQGVWQMAAQSPAPKAHLVLGWGVAGAGLESTDVSGLKVKQN